MVVGMDRLFGSHLAAGNFDGAVRNDFVHVHVRLRTAARLPDAQRKLVIQLARDDFIRRLNDQLGFVGWEFAEILIHKSAGLFQGAEGADEFGRHSVAADVEVQQRSLGLRSPVNVRGDFDFPHAVGFNAGLRGGFGESRHESAPDASAEMSATGDYSALSLDENAVVYCLTLNAIRY